MIADRLSSDAIRQLHDQPSSAGGFRPFLQVVHIKMIQPASVVEQARYCLVLSDGTYCISCLLGPDLSSSFPRDGITLHAVIQLIEYSPKFVAGKLILLVDVMELIEACAHRLGSEHPIYFELETATMSSLLQAQLELLVHKERHIERLCASVQENARAAADLITLNVGGQRFQTAKANLLRDPDAYFSVMLSTAPTHEDGSYFVDVNPTHFDRIMAHVRTGEPIALDGLCAYDAHQLRQTIAYLGLETALASP
ncbi:hypothetical protein SPRG_03132 [Saprolegnia parasitica CBS 223.65]|uniref:BTB domain-containing protein n=1 Tax=Saprolegnia parasitica (strain CBS 223.65) TaxID=695850 RepID=A0A067CZG5_SAPPC|nr:hypothetical protein SPRG_03132 [Saprolegnia parasitica CBS 223.65]KDO31916.1 hypothetical protein SPRG_03132 [Saprolegnia parasitica CBS 223.65]|eukprot:XP_012197115.1 hypothetical protein SPRG_03132 [Saprolegnia parasitica CBS 223.65]